MTTAKPIYIACDDSGYEAKLEVIKYLEERSIEYFDCGSNDVPSRYPYYAAKVASAVSTGVADRGILLCGSGIGMSIAANKFKGVRASVISDSYSARLTRRHNDSNILCLGAQTVGKWTLLSIVDTWLSTEYDGGHHNPSIELIFEIEKENFSGNNWCPDEIPYPEFNWNSDQSL